jgi:hypothetical protein
MEFQLVMAQMRRKPPARLSFGPRSGMRSSPTGRTRNACRQAP